MWWTSRSNAMCGRGVYAPCCSHMRTVLGLLVMLTFWPLCGSSANASVEVEDYLEAAEKLCEVKINAFAECIEHEIQNMEHPQDAMHRCDKWYRIQGTFHF